MRRSGGARTSQSPLYKGLSLRTPWTDVHMKIHLQMNINVLPLVGVWGFARRRARIPLGVLYMATPVPLSRGTAEGWPISG